MFIENNNKGQSLLEIILALAIFSLLALTLVVLTVGGGSALTQGAEQTEAMSIAASGLEAVRSVRGHAWNELIYDDLEVSTSGSRWLLNPGAQENFGKYTRVLTMENVCRDVINHDQTVCPAGEIDLQTKKLNSEVSWAAPNGTINSVRYSTLLSNWGSRNFMEDLSVDFNDGAFFSTMVSDTAGDGNGSVVLVSTGGDCGWVDCPLNSSTISLSGNTSAKKVFAQNIASSTYFYTATGDNNGVFYVYNVDDKNTPILLGSYAVGDTVNGLYVSGSYAYLATGNNSKELIILNVTNPAVITEAGFYNAGSNSDGLDVYVSGNRAYLVTARGSNPEFYILNISNPATPVLANATGIFELNQDVNAVVTDGGYAYLATAGNSEEFIILNISNEASITQTGFYNLTGNNDGVDLVKSGNYIFLINGAGGTLGIVDVSNPAMPTLTGSYTDSGSLNGVSVFGDYLFLASSWNGGQFIILDIVNKNSPAVLSVFDNNSTGLDVFYFDNHIYFGNTDNTGEVKIFWLGSSSVVYATSGEYESSIIDLGDARAIQILSWQEDVSVRSGCEINLQLKTAELSENLISLPWSGPGGVDTFYTIPSGTIIPVAHNGDRYLQYKVFLTGDGVATPVLNNVTVNYK